MTRIAILLIALTACTSGSKEPEVQAAPAAKVAAPPPRNFVCERVKIANETAKCTPEYTDAGEHHTHSARVEVGKKIVSCVINDATVSVVCGDLIAAPQPPAQPQPEEPKKSKHR